MAVIYRPKWVPQSSVVDPKLTRAVKEAEFYILHAIMYVSQLPGKIGECPVLKAPAGAGLRALLNYFGFEGWQIMNFRKLSLYQPVHNI